MPVIFFSKLDPQKRGYFEGGATAPAQIRGHSHRQHPPIFPRTERVLAESPATLRGSCSPEMAKIRNNILSGGQDRPLTPTMSTQMPLCNSANSGRQHTYPSLYFEDFTALFFFGFVLWNSEEFEFLRLGCS